MRVLYKAFICDDSCICRVRRWYECMYGCVYIDDCQVCPRGPMDKASAYEAGDCGFESRRRLSFFLMHRDVSRNPGFESQSPPSFLTLFHISITNIPTHEFRRYIVSFTLFPLYTARMQPDISTIQTLSVCSQNIQHVVYTKRT